jgi:hypothetical protein
VTVAGPALCLLALGWLAWEAQRAARELRADLRQRRAAADLLTVQRLAILRDGGLTRTAGEAIGAAVKATGVSLGRLEERRRMRRHLQAIEDELADLNARDRRLFWSERKRHRWLCWQREQAVAVLEWLSVGAGPAPWPRGR